MTTEAGQTAAAGRLSLRDTIAPKSDQLNYDDFPDGLRCVMRVVGLKAGDAQQPVVVEVEEAATGKRRMPYKPCKSMRRVLVAAWGDKGKDWMGKLFEVYGDPGVVFGGVEVGGLRVSAVSGIEKALTVKLAVTRGKRGDYVVRPINAADYPAKGEAMAVTFPPNHDGVHVVSGAAKEAGEGAEAKA